MSIDIKQILCPGENLGEVCCKVRHMRSSARSHLEAKKLKIFVRALFWKIPLGLPSGHLEELFGEP